MSGISILVDEDKVVFDPVMTGGLGFLSGLASTNVIASAEKLESFLERPVAIQGDERKWVVPAFPYTGTAFPIPGVVKCEIQELNPAHVSKKIQFNKKFVLLAGNSGIKFIAKFTVTTPAFVVTPAGKQDDPTPMYFGTGYFAQIIPSKSSDKLI